jgi:hypothetical protein
VLGILGWVFDDCRFLSFNARHYPAVLSFQPPTKKGQTYP